MTVVLPPMRVAKVGLLRPSRIVAGISVGGTWWE